MAQLTVEFDNSLVPRIRAAFGKPAELMSTEMVPGTVNDVRRAVRDFVIAKVLAHEQAIARRDAAAAVTPIAAAAIDEP